MWTNLVLLLRPISISVAHSHYFTVWFYIPILVTSYSLTWFVSIHRGKLNGNAIYSALRNSSIDRYGDENQKSSEKKSYNFFGERLKMTFESTWYSGRLVTQLGQLNQQSVICKQQLQISSSGLPLLTFSNWIEKKINWLKSEISKNVKNLVALKLPIA